MTVWMLEGVREARIRCLGCWEAIAWAREEPMLLGDMPVMMTGNWC